MGKNKNLAKAKKARNDEFYTRIEDIEIEMQHYVDNDCFQGKHIYLNCDKPGKSAFWNYFYNGFAKFGLSMLSATYKTLDGTNSVLFQYDGNTLTTTPLQCDGSYDRDECELILQKCDIVITNPPFSLFLQYINYLIKHKKDFIVIGNANSMFCKDIFPLLQEQKIQIGFNKPKLFDVPQDYIANNIKVVDGHKYAVFGNICWYSSIIIDKNLPMMNLTKTYDSALYEKYDNYNAIEVPSLKDIPCDYYGIMGVPVSIMEKYNPNQFEIIWQASGNTRACCPPSILKELGYQAFSNDKGGACILNGKLKYTRVFIRRK